MQCQQTKNRLLQPLDAYLWNLVAGHFVLLLSLWAVDHWLQRARLGNDLILSVLGWLWFCYTLYNTRRVLWGEAVADYLHAPQRRPGHWVGVGGLITLGLGALWVSIGRVQPAPGPVTTAFGVTIASLLFIFMVIAARWTFREGRRLVCEEPDERRATASMESLLRDKLVLRLGAVGSLLIGVFQFILSLLSGLSHHDSVWSALAGCFVGLALIGGALTALIGKKKT